MKELIREYKKLSEEEKKDVQYSRNKRQYEKKKNNEHYKSYQKKYHRDRYRKEKLKKLMSMKNVVFILEFED